MGLCCFYAISHCNNITRLYYTSINYATFFALIRGFIRTYSRIAFCRVLSRCLACALLACCLLSLLWAVKEGQNLARLDRFTLQDFMQKGEALKRSPVIIWFLIPSHVPLCPQVDN